MSSSMPVQWYHSEADPIWSDGTFKQVDQELTLKRTAYLSLAYHSDWSEGLECRLTTVVDQKMNDFEPHEYVVRQARNLAVSDLEISNLEQEDVLGLKINN